MNNAVPIRNNTSRLTSVMRGFSNNTPAQAAMGSATQPTLVPINCVASTKITNAINAPSINN